MLYLLDANTLIDANRDYYPVYQFPEFWNWLAHSCEQNIIKMPREIFDEIKPYPASPDERGFHRWLQQYRGHLILQESVGKSLPQEISDECYGSNLTETEVEKIGGDAFLLAHAYTKKGSRTIVTTEVSKPKKKRANRKIPDICKDLEIPCINNFALTKELGFKTADWPRELILDPPPSPDLLQ